MERETHSIRVTAAPIHGAAAAPPSKSAAHRALICAALAGTGRVRGVSGSDDMRATVGALTALGARITLTGTVAEVTAADPTDRGPRTVDCLESGSTLRFLLPLFAAKGIPAVFTGRGRLPQRPLGVYADCLPAHGVDLAPQTVDAALPLTVTGRLRAGTYSLPGDVSSQFLTGLLFALPLCDGDSELILTTPLQSAAYVDMTAQAQALAGVTVERTSSGYRIPGGQRYRPREYTVEGDWSQAAFLLAMGALGGEATVSGLSPTSAQGDREIVALLRRFGAQIEQNGDTVTCRRAPLHGIDIDAAQIPDLVPVLAAVAALAPGTTRITGAARLRLKESDRLAATTHSLGLLGARVEQTPDGLIIEGLPRLRGGTEAPGWGDHRIVMSLAVAAVGCEEPVTIRDAASVDKSWPEFFTVVRRMGGNADVV